MVFRWTKSLVLVAALLVTACSESEESVEQVEDIMSTTDMGVAQQPTDEPGVTSYHALLIGINDYKDPQVSDLNGAVNDVRLLSHVLTTRFGFPDSSIKTLTDASATRENILSSVQQLVASAGPEDIVYLHFSGHGSQVADTDGDEVDDNKDESIVPYDGRTDDVRDITDDELGALLSQFQTPNVLVVLDACHSGSGTRSLAVRNRSIPTDNRQALYQGVTTRGAPQSNVVDALNYVLMTGASASQSALDGPIDNEHYGIFSFALAKALDAGPAASPSTLMRGVGDEFIRIRQAWGDVALPDPQLEAASYRLNSAVFPGLSESSEDFPTRAFLVARKGNSGPVILEGAVDAGVAIGSVWAVYPSDELTFDDGALATMTVSALQGDDAIATLASGSDFAGDGRAVEILPPTPSDGVRVDVRGDQTMRARLVDALNAAFPDVEIVSGTEFAEFIVEASAQSIELFDASGTVLQGDYPAEDIEAAAQHIAGRLASQHAGASLTALANEVSELQLSVELVAAERLRGIGLVGSASGARYHIMDPGEQRSSKNSLAVDIESEQDVFLTIASVNSRGEVTVLFPNAYQNDSFVTDGFVKSGERVRIPDNLSSTNAAGFHWDLIPPAGQDTIKVFASTRRETANAIRRYVERLAAQTRASLGAPDQSDITGGDLSSLRQQLGTRGIGVTAASGDVATVESTTTVGGAQRADWTVRTLFVDVSE